MLVSKTMRRGCESLLARHFGIEYGSLGESGRPHFPVTEEIMGSNPIRTAIFVGG